MKFQKTILATATGAAIVAAGSANAFSLGEVWANDQQNGRLHIWSQSNLNSAWAPSRPSVVDITTMGGAHSSPKTHIIGFSNNAGLDPSSRAIMTYLDGWVEIYNSNGGTGSPTKVAELEASTNNAYSEESLGTPASVAGGKSGNTVHACGGNPQNDQIQCASIFNADFTLFEADMATNIYSRIGIYKTGNLTVSPAIAGTDLGDKVQANYDQLVANDGDGQPNNICSQYSTDGNLLYLAVQNNVIDGGVIIVDVSDPTNPTILDAFNDTMAAGCGLVNDPDGEHLWITHGFNKQGDPEEVSIWKYRRAGKRSGPIKRISLPTDDSQITYGGDAHGMQFAGYSSDYLWQVMRVDDTIHVLKNNKDKKRRSKLVKTIDLERPGRANIQPDVIDRSALGGKMYWTTRGVSPNTAISTYFFSDRDGESGVDTYRVGNYGRNGSYVKTSGMPSGVTEYLCPAVAPDVDADGVNHGGTGYETNCTATDAGAVLVDSTDPHGLKSLNYLSGF